MSCDLGASFTKLEGRLLSLNLGWSYDLFFSNRMGVEKLVGSVVVLGFIRPCISLFFFCLWLKTYYKMQQDQG